MARCTNTSRHARSVADGMVCSATPATESVLRRDSIGSTRYAQYVGRIGALAVALGVATAVVTSPGIARADETGADTPSQNDPGPGDGPHADPPGPSADPDPSPASGITTATGGTSTTATNDTSTTHTATTTTTLGSAVTDTIVAGGNEVVISHSGGPNPSIEVTPAPSPPAVPAAPLLDPAVDLPTVGATPSPTPSPTPVVGPTAVPALGAVLVEAQPPVDQSGSGTTVLESSINGALVATDPNRASLIEHGGAADVTSARLSTDSTPTITGDLLPTGTPAGRSTLALLAPAPAPAAVPAPDVISTLLAIPGTFITVALDLIGSFLAPLTGPGAPFENPVLLAVLAFVRRQFSQNLANSSPLLAPQQTSSVPDLDDRQVHGTFGPADPDGDALFYSVPTSGPGAAAHGVVTIDQAARTWTYTPVSGFAGDDAFTVTVTDDTGAPHIHALGQTHLATARVAVVVAAPNDGTPEVIDPPTDDDGDGQFEVTVRFGGGGAYENVVIPAPGQQGSPNYWRVQQQSYDPQTGEVKFVIVPTTAAMLLAGQGRDVVDSFILVATSPGAQGRSSVAGFALRSAPETFAAQDASTSVPLPQPPGATLTVTGGPIPTGDRPTGVVVTDKFAYVFNSVAQGTVTVIDADPTSPTFNQPIDFDTSTPAIDPIIAGNTPLLGTLVGDRLYVVNSASGGFSTVPPTITVIDTTDNSIVGGPIMLPPNTLAAGPTASPDGRRLYLNAFDEVIVVDIDPTSATYYTVVDRIRVAPARPTQSPPTGVPLTYANASGTGAFSADGTLFYVPRTVTNITYTATYGIADYRQSGDIVVIDTATGAVVGDPIALDLLPGLAVSDGSRLYLTSIDQSQLVPGQAVDFRLVDGYVTVLDIDPDSATFQQEVDLDLDTPGIQRTPVGGYPVNLALSPDGSVAYVVNVVDGTISVIDTVTGLDIVDPVVYDTAPVTSTSTPDFGPNVIAISPDGKQLYVSRYGKDSAIALSIA